MSKILITALGSGSYNKEKGIKEYNPTKYYVEEEESPLKETAFIASAIDEKWKMNKIIIIGTTGSMWSNVYKKYCEDENIEIDEEYYNKLRKVEVKANKDTPIEDLEIEKFNETFKGKIKGIVVKYGVNDKENLENFYSIIGIEKEIGYEDKVFIDITHAFRSMSFWLFLIITYLTDVSDKKIDIQNITYGMFEAKNEKKETPIISLNLFSDILKWFKGASELKNYGNSYTILEELEKNLKNKEIRNELENFSDTMNINYIDSLEKSFENFNNIKEKVTQLEGPGKYIIPQILENFINEFDFQNKEKINEEKRKYLLRAKLAKWHFDQKRYAMAAININEAIVDFIMETLNFPVIDTEIKTDKSRLAKVWLEQVKEIKDVEVLNKYGVMYVETRSIRNKVAHSLDNVRELKDDIKNLKEYSDNIFKLLNSEVLVREKDMELEISKKLIEEHNKKAEIKEDKQSEKLLVVSLKGLNSEELEIIKNKFKIHDQPLYLSKKEREKWRVACETNTVESLNEIKTIIDRKIGEGDYILIIGEFKYKNELEQYSNSKNIKSLRKVLVESFDIN